MLNRIPGPYRNAHPVRERHLLNVLRAASSATLVDTTSFSSHYDRYEFDFEALAPSVSGSFYNALLSSDFGSSWIATNYHSTLVTNGTVHTDATFLSVIMPIGFFAATGISTSYGLTGRMALVNPNGSNLKGFGGLVWGINASGASVSELNSSSWQVPATPINGIQFATSAGNFNNGVIRVYGVKTIQ